MVTEPQVTLVAEMVSRSLREAVRASQLVEGVPQLISAHD